MREFFHGWRRTIGVLTLVLACVLTTGWVRSLVVLDRITLFTRERMFERIALERGYIVVFSTVASPAPGSPEWVVIPLPRQGVFPWEDRFHGGWWRWHFFGNGIYEWTRDQQWWSKYYVIEYRVIVIPLTVLSAYLLLSKARPRKPPETTKPLNEATVTHA